MEPLLVSLTVAALGAAAFGALMGASAAFARADASPLDHPVLAALVRRRHPILNVIFAIGSWGLVLFLLPKLALWIFGVSDSAALGLSMAIQLCTVAVSLLFAERLWNYRTR